MCCCVSRSSRMGRKGLLLRLARLEKGSQGVMAASRAARGPMTDLVVASRAARVGFVDVGTRNAHPRAVAWHLMSTSSGRVYLETTVKNALSARATGRKRWQRGSVLRSMCTQQTVGAAKRP